MTTYTMLFSDRNLLDSLIHSAEQAGFHYTGSKFSLLRDGKSIQIVLGDNTPVATITRSGPNLVMETVGGPNTALVGLIDEFMQSHPDVIHPSGAALLPSVSTRLSSTRQSARLSESVASEQRPVQRPIQPQHSIPGILQSDPPVVQQHSDTLTESHSGLRSLRPRRAASAETTPIDTHRLFPTSAELSHLISPPSPDLSSHLAERTLTTRQWNQIKDHLASRRYEINTYGQISRPVDGVTIGTVTWGRNEFGAQTFHLQLFPGLSNIVQSIDQMLGRVPASEEQRRESRH